MRVMLAWNAADYLAAQGYREARARCPGADDAGVDELRAAVDAVMGTVDGGAEGSAESTEPAA